MDDRKLAAICRHELLLVDDKVVARLIREVRKLQDDSNDIYAMLLKDQRINAREIMSGIMLAWTYVVCTFSDYKLLYLEQEVLRSPFGLSHSSDFCLEEVLTRKSSQEGLDDLGPGQRFFWQGKVSHPDALIWPKDKKK